MLVDKRREKIKQIISEKEVNTQTELAKILTNEGFNVTQATVSRDIKELGLVKEKGRILNYRYVLPENNGLTINLEGKVVPLLKSYIVSVVCACNLVVVKTFEGHASACGMAIDKLELSGVVGSVAGDDTLLIVASSESVAVSVTQKIKGYVGLW